MLAGCPEHVTGLAKDEALVGSQVDHAVGEHHVDTAIRQGDLLEIALEGLGVVYAPANADGAFGALLTDRAPSDPDIAAG